MHCFIPSFVVFFRYIIIGVLFKLTKVSYSKRLTSSSTLLLLFLDISVARGFNRSKRVAGFEPGRPRLAEESRTFNNHVFFLSSWNLTNNKGGIFEKDSTSPADTVNNANILESCAMFWIVFFAEALGKLANQGFKVRVLAYWLEAGAGPTIDLVGRC